MNVNDVKPFSTSKLVENAWDSFLGSMESNHQSVHISLDLNHQSVHITIDLCLNSEQK